MLSSQLEVHQHLNAETHLLLQQLSGAFLWTLSPSDSLAADLLIASVLCPQVALLM